MPSRRALTKMIWDRARRSSAGLGEVWLRLFQELGTVGNRLVRNPADHPRGSLRKPGPVVPRHLHGADIRNGITARSGQLRSEVKMLSKARRRSGGSVDNGDREPKAAWSLGYLKLLTI
jgi:hypothetical protein